MYLFFWLFVFVASLIVLIKAADYFTESSERIGIDLKIPPFIVGIAIVSIGTSLPELATSLIAVYKGETEIAVANAVGSNIANILLVIGIASIVARKMSIKRSLINLDLPLLAIATTISLFTLMDKIVTFSEGCLLILTYAVYTFYIISSKHERKVLNHIPDDKNVVHKKIEITSKFKKIWNFKPKVEIGVIFTLIVSAFFIYLGASYTIESIVNIANELNIGTALIAMSAVAIGTSLPELVVSVNAVRKKKYEIALGNVFGSNIFNILVVIGLPALVCDLKIDDVTFIYGIPFLIGATVLYVFSGISRKIYNWEGMMYLILYTLFIIKIFGIV